MNWGFWGEENWFVSEFGVVFWLLASVQLDAGPQGREDVEREDEEEDEEDKDYEYKEVALA